MEVLIVTVISILSIVGSAFMFLKYDDKVIREELKQRLMLEGKTEEEADEYLSMIYRPRTERKR